MKEKQICKCCGDCCTEYIPWTKEELIKVAAYLKKHQEIKEQNKNNKTNDFKVFCAFNDEKTHKCLIYPVRPSICRTFSCKKGQLFISKNRNEHLKRAFVNGLPFNINAKYCSTHSLFFKNFEWDKTFIILNKSTKDIFKLIYIEEE